MGAKGGVVELCSIALGIPRLRPWREALEDYMGRAGLAA